MSRSFSLIFVFLFIHFISTAQQLQLKEQEIRLMKGLKFKLKVPNGYKISVAAQGLQRPRFFAKSPDGRLFVTDMYDRSDNTKGSVLILEDWNEKEKRFEKITTYLDNLHNPNQVLFYQRNGSYFLYVAETDKLSFYAYKAGDSKPSSEATVIAHFPDYGLNYKYGGWHLTRSIAFHNNKLYVSIGSSCNACIEKEDVRATVLEMDPDGKNQKIFARGLRNSVGIKWINNELWCTTMGRDLIGPDKPEDLFTSVKQGEYYGWPFYYQYQNKVYPDKSFNDSVRNVFVKKPPVAPWGFKAHSAPLGFEYINGFSDSLLNHSFLVALHGSTSVWRQRGNAVVQLMPNGKYREIVTGFLQGKTEDKRFGRPCDVIQWNAQSFFISDDKNGVIYFVEKK
jgi:glucose/arabinose dehydrogenase